MINENVLEEAQKIMAAFFKRRRLELKLSQIELAERCGFTSRTIINFENCNYWMGTKQMLILCEALHLFPSFIEMEAEDDTAATLRANWAAKPKAMTIEDALLLKAQRYNQDGQHN